MNNKRLTASLTGGIPLAICGYKKMQLSNLSLIYTEDDQQDTVKLDSLVLDNDNSQEPLQVSAAGTVNARASKLKGTVVCTADTR